MLVVWIHEPTTEESHSFLKHKVQVFMCSCDPFCSSDLGKAHNYAQKIINQLYIYLHKNSKCCHLGVCCVVSVNSGLLQELQRRGTCHCAKVMQFPTCSITHTRLLGPSRWMCFWISDSLLSKMDL